MTSDVRIGPKVVAAVQHWQWPFRINFESFLFCTRCRCSSIGKRKIKFPFLSGSLQFHLKYSGGDSMRGCHFKVCLAFSPIWAFGFSMLAYIAGDGYSVWLAGWWYKPLQQPPPPTSLYNPCTTGLLDTFCISWPHARISAIPSHVPILQTCSL